MPTSATPFPPPPAFYVLCDGYDAAARLPPPRPPKRGSTHAAFGATHDDATLEEIARRTEFAHPVVCDASADAREEIVKCANAACERYVDVLRNCVDAPGMSDGSAHACAAILNNAHRTINDVMRPAQAMADLEYRMRVMIDEKRETIEALRKAVKEAREIRDGLKTGDAGKTLGEALGSPGRKN